MKCDNLPVFIVMYHYIKNSKDPLFMGLKGLPTETFDKQLTFFENNFNVITMEELVGAVLNRHEKKFPNNAMLLTFDDGYYCHYSSAYPILKQHHLQGSFFIPAQVLDNNRDLLSTNKIHLIIAKGEISKIYNNIISLLYRNNIDPNELMKHYPKTNRYDDPKTAFCKTILQNLEPLSLREELTEGLFQKFVSVDQANIAAKYYLNREQLRRMQADGMFIGVHGYRHDRLGLMPTKELQTDIDRSLEIMSEFINPRCWVMNYPFGHSNKQVAEYVCRKGACLALTTEPKIADLNFDDPYLLPRLDCNDFPPISENYRTDNVRRI